MSIQEKIRAYHGDIVRDGHHRYRSWEHCYGFFRRKTRAELIADRDTAALQLGFYLASWGMYRGSSFLLQHAYTAHLGCVDGLAGTEFSMLWEMEFGSEDDDHVSIDSVELAVRTVQEAYAPFGKPTDTLVTKVILGTLGCLPAVDRYFIAGFKYEGLQYSYLNRRFLKRIKQFSLDNITALREEQRRIEGGTGVRYPLMKLIDMYFWQIGYERDASIAGTADSE